MSKTDSHSGLPPGGENVKAGKKAVGGCVRNPRICDLKRGPLSSEGRGSWA